MGSRFEMSVFERGRSYQKKETFAQLADFLEMPEGTDLRPYLNAWQEQLADDLVKSGRFTKVTRIWLIDTGRTETVDGE